VLGRGATDVDHRGVDLRPIGELLVRQSGVVCRRQLLALGAQPHDIARQVRRREMTRVHPGVYVEHNGPLSWTQRAWAAVLAVWPAALCDRSALGEMPGSEADPGFPIHVAVALERRVLARSGVRVHRRARFDQLVQWNLGPPRVRYEHAVLEVAASARSEFAAVAVLSEACRTRRTTPQRLAMALRERHRTACREWLSAVLTDIASGTASVLSTAT
jgi:hypothetical protein